MIAEVRSDTEKAGDFPLLAKMFNLLRKWQVGKTIAVVGKELIVLFEVFLDCFQALSDIGMDSRIRKGDPPIMDVGVEKLKILPTTRQDKIIRSALIVIQEVILDCVGPVPQAQNKVLVPKVGVILHYMPKDRPRTDSHHRFWDALRIFPETHAQTTTKQYYFHELLLCIVGFKRKRSFRQGI